ncbi:NUDIX hydrolase [Thalassoroseus pseudoceratinae]|uniref:NUDIX hydrolase n=1 Tax=Thalassoroseus pseudoceratinae TaxID=2713176 RepID=UPI00141DB3CC|nr:NUDIX domain-containing protein [Thalassoroseus pseudoceratinae]
MTDGTEDIFDVVDAKDQVIRQELRSVVHREKLLHRAVHIFVFNASGELFLQLRSKTKDEYPSRFTSSASGHVDAGETYEIAAVRELREELGITGELEFLTKLPARKELANEHSALYRMTTEDELTLDTEEIAGGDFYPVAEIAAWILRDPHKFSPPFLVLFDWYRRRFDY